MFFRETKETEEDIRRMFHEARDKMKNKITLKKKSDPGKFAIPCLVKGIEFPHALCDTGASVSILPTVMANHLGMKVKPSKESFTFVDCSQRNSGEIVRDLELQIVDTATPSDGAKQHTEEYDEDYEEERATEYISIHVEEDRLLHHSYGIRNATSIDRTIPTLIDTYHDQTQTGGVDDRFKPKYRQHTRPSIDIRVPTSIDRHPEFGKRAYDRAGIRRFHWEQKNEYGVYKDDHEHARGVDGHINHVSKDDIRNLLERASMDEHNYICLPEHARSYGNYSYQKLPPQTQESKIEAMLDRVLEGQQNMTVEFNGKIDPV
ncbi:hypothetical protein F2Q69_00012398 [Brassica cretica]|uniref:Aspartic peptidase DDI1-type domain-containing protein n=1 Tax=Brassica cretica TaxID=69181 RepID=A0A8S9R520_BRACR|nr:hypothetical protein F2Q69_00012398 [Brassica cretica]